MSKQYLILCEASLRHAIQGPQEARSSRRHTLQIMVNPMARIEDGRDEASRTCQSCRNRRCTAAGAGHCCKELRCSRLLHGLPMQAKKQGTMKTALKL